jgi:type IV pilus assembly protein PilQ
MNDIENAMKKYARHGHWAVLAASMAAAPVALAAGSIQSITGAQQANGEVIRIELSEAMTMDPVSFSTQTPPRIAFDLPGVSNGLGRSLQELGLSNVRSVHVAQGDTRTRLVLNLKQNASYRTLLSGKTLLVMVDPSAQAANPVVESAAMPVASAAAAPLSVASRLPAAAATNLSAQAANATLTAPVSTRAVANAPASPSRFAEPLNVTPLALRDIDFRRGDDGTGRVVVELPSTQVGVDIRQQGKGLVVEFLRSTLPDALRRRFDVKDFGTPVQAMSATQVGDRVRLVVDSSGNWEHSAYQTDTQFVLEVRPHKSDPQKLVPGPGYAGDKLSLNFQNIEVRSLLQVIADFTNFNVVTSDTVSGTVTLRLKDVPWDHALDIILQAKGLGVRKNGNVLWIAPKDELAAKDKVDLEARAQVADLEPLRTHSFQLSYTKADEVAPRLMGQLAGAAGSPAAGGGAGTRMLTKRGSVISEPRTNQLFVTDIPSKLEEISQLITKIDIPVRQVMIEARIVEAEDTFGRSLGVKLGTNDLRAQQGGVPGWSVVGNNRVAVGGNYTSIGANTNQGAAGDYANTQLVNLPANALNAGSAATFALSLFSATANRFLNLELSAMESEGKGKVVSSPRVITADQVKALIEQGTELPYQSATSSGATAVSFRKANLKLEVIPQITPEGGIILDVDVNKDSVGQQTAAGFAINTKHVKTQVLVENGGTVVIGGIFEVTENDVVNRVPLLGDIPYLGALFRNKTRQVNKTELLIFLTPKVITDRNAAAR